MFTTVNKGDRVLCIEFPLRYDGEGCEINSDLKVGGHYTVENTYILTLSLKEIPGLFLKSYFRKLPST